MDYHDKILLNGQGVSRKVIIINPVTQAVITKTQSDNNGDIFATLPDGTDSIIVVAIDDIGGKFLSGVYYQTGQRVIANSEYNGVAYEVILAGHTGSVEPQWPKKIGETVVSGEVIFQAVPYYRPVAKFVPF